MMVEYYIILLMQMFTFQKVTKNKGAGRVGKAGSGSLLHKFSSYKCYIFKSSILRNSGARKNVLKTTLISTFTN